VRTVAEGKSVNEVEADLKDLMQKWDGLFEALKVHGTNIIINNGITAGQKIPHFSKLFSHYHFRGKNNKKLKLSKNHTKITITITITITIMIMIMKK
jgi:diadenosine tetraphosphate (Ap4A) HIT family hydrolase